MIAHNAVYKAFAGKPIAILALDESLDEKSSIFQRIKPYLDASVYNRNLNCYQDYGRKVYYIDGAVNLSEKNITFKEENENEDTASV